MGLFATLRSRLTIFYVFAHEMTHVLSALVCGARVHGWHVGREGGWVDTNKSNLFISLSPYLVPLYMVGVLLAFGILGLFTDLAHLPALHIGPVVVPVNASMILHYLVGFTWAFHLSFTFTVMRAEQGDLVRNGQFFSVWLIALVNLYLAAWFLIAASPDLHWSDVWKSFADMAVTAFRAASVAVVWMVDWASA